MADCRAGEALPHLGDWKGNWAAFEALRRTKWGPAEAQRKRVRWGEEEQWNERVFALWGGNERYGACDDEKQDKGQVSPGQAQLPAVRAVTGVCAG